jgi:hypothetical protein
VPAKFSNVGVVLGFAQLKARASVLAFFLPSARRANQAILTDPEIHANVYHLYQPDAHIVPRYPIAHEKCLVWRIKIALKNNIVE